MKNVQYLKEQTRQLSGREQLVSNSCLIYLIPELASISPAANMLRRCYSFFRPERSTRWPPLDLSIRHLRSQSKHSHVASAQAAARMLGMNASTSRARLHLDLQTSQHPPFSSKHPARIQVSIFEEEMATIKAISLGDQQAGNDPPSTPEHATFLDLPGELRNRVYGLLLPDHPVGQLKV
jgi:hypothetical protein